MNETKKWYIICCKARKETTVYNELKKKGIEAKFFQKTTTLATKKDIRKVLKPLISGYVFVYIFEHEIGKYQFVEGVAYFLNFNNKFEYLNDKDILHLEKLCAHNYYVNLCNKLTEGIKIEITEGILKGWQGSIKKNTNSNHIYIESALKNIDIVIKKEDITFKIIEK